jgi:hypothetical protein
MKKMLPIGIISLFILLALCQTYAVAENTKLPRWVSKLHAKLNQTFQLLTPAVNSGHQ